jgi:hypothetical protein
MPKPDYARWDAVNEFTAEEAAFLLQDIEPCRPLPAAVRALARELDATLKPDRDTSVTLPSVRRSLYGGQEYTVPGPKFYTRATLRAYATLRGIEAPAFFPEFRELAGKLKRQAARIQEVAKELKYDPLPGSLSELRKAKAEIRKRCLRDRSLFTESVFNTAWKAASLPRKSS